MYLMYKIYIYYIYVGNLILVYLNENVSTISSDFIKMDMAINKA